MWYFIIRGDLPGWYVPEELVEAFERHSSCTELLRDGRERAYIDLPGPFLPMRTDWVSDALKIQTPLTDVPGIYANLRDATQTALGAQRHFTLEGAYCKMLLTPEQRTELLEELKLTMEQCDAEIKEQQQQLKEALDEQEPALPATPVGGTWN
ncbi:MAG: hypothetical protein ACYSX0_22705 [Planctomycetota bacterium]|jgi:hypothetical protein